jgi:hypothetical protein
LALTLIQIFLRSDRADGPFTIIATNATNNTNTNTITTAVAGVGFVSEADKPASPLLRRGPKQSQR